MPVKSCNSSCNKKKRKNKCKGCACAKLRKLPRNTEVDVFLSGGTVLEDVVFKKLNKKNCCAKFKDFETEPGSTIFADCNFIQAFRIEAD